MNDWPRPPEGEVQACGHSVTVRLRNGSCNSCNRIARRGPNLRHCKTCNTEVPPRFHYCDGCIQERRYKRDLTRAPRPIGVDTRTHYQYGLTREEYQRIMSGPCGICGQRVARMHMDHDHNCCPGTRTCGKCIRGVLCHRCNLGLGFYEGWFIENRDAALAWIEKGRSE